MEDIIKPYYCEMKEILKKTSLENVDFEELDFQVETLNHKYDKETEKQSITSNVFEIEGEDAVFGLLTKFERLKKEYKFINRDSESHLAMNRDWGEGKYTPQCPYSEGDFPDIKKEITAFIRQRVKTSEDEMSKPLLTGNPKKQLTMEQSMYIADRMTSLSQFLSDYVNNYDDEYNDWSWNWQWDCKLLIQYVFDKAAELSYKVAKGESTEDLFYDIQEIYSYFQLSVSEEFQEKIDSVVNKLENITDDIIVFVRDKKYNLCNKDTWLQTILLNIAVYGTMYALEQDIE